MLKSTESWTTKVKNYTFTKEDIKNIKYNLKLKKERLLVFNVITNSMHFVLFDSDIEYNEFLVLTFNDKLKDEVVQNNKIIMDKFYQIYNSQITSTINLYFKLFLKNEIVIKQLFTNFPLTDDILNKEFIIKNYDDVLNTIQLTSLYWNQNRLYSNIIKKMINKYSTETILSFIPDTKDAFSTKVAMADPFNGKKEYFRYILDIFNNNPNAINNFLSIYKDFDFEKKYSYYLTNDEKFMQKTVHIIPNFFQSSLTFNNLILYCTYMYKKQLKYNNKSIVDSLHITKIILDEETIKYVNVHNDFNINNIEVLDLIKYIFKNNITFEFKEISESDLILFNKKICFIRQWLNLQNKYNNYTKIFLKDQNPKFINSDTYSKLIDNILLAIKKQEKIY